MPTHCLSAGLADLQVHQRCLHGTKAASSTRHSIGRSRGFVVAGPGAARLLSHSTPHHLVALASAQPFASAPDPFLPLSSIADMRRQAASDMDDFFSGSPFSTMRRLDDMMEQQFQQMDPFGGGSSSFRSLEDRMQQNMREMDRQMDRVWGDLDRAQREMDAELQRGLRQLQEQQPGVRIERQEEKSPGSYR